MQKTESERRIFALESDTKRNAPVLRQARFKHKRLLIKDRAC